MTCFECIITEPKNKKIVREDRMSGVECLHEDKINKITELEAKAEYKEKRIEELYDKMDKMETKLNNLNENINTLILQSTKEDKELELRLKAIETELALQKQISIENHNRVSSLLAVVGVGLTIITILINVYFNIIH